MGLSIRHDGESGVCAATGLTMKTDAICPTATDVFSLDLSGGAGHQWAGCKMRNERGWTV
jgi:hypothetical protein